MSGMITINSDFLISEYDTHHKVSAGPGAGKTTWLVNNIANLAKKSELLHNSAKIACITYTNAASENIRSKLEDCSDVVVATTIHSFLFANIVRPYLHLLTDKNGDCLVNHSLVKNHYEPRPNYGKVREWLVEIKARNKKALINQTAYNYIKKCQWQLQADGTWKFAPVKWTKSPKYFPSTKLHIYKELQWRKGEIEHDDVLYFSYIILANFQYLASHLSAMYPYIFIDEFQDTDPRQTQIVKWIAENGGSYVGVIGDSEQAIYGFCGAERDDFTNFSLPDVKEYTISDNWRSSDNIVSLLNNIRQDSISQTGRRGVQGNDVQVLIGDISLAYQKVKEQRPVLLARNNEHASLLRDKNFINPATSNIWEEFEEIDLHRFLFVRTVLESLLLLESNHIGMAIKNLVDGIKVREGKYSLIMKAPFITKQLKKAMALSILSCLKDDQGELLSKPFLDTYLIINEGIKKVIPEANLKKVMTGKFKTFAGKHTLQNLLDTVNMIDDTRIAKTIHKAKGEEFESVLLYLSKEEDFDLIFDPGSSHEEHRILYVGLSRARDNLAISIPTLNDARRDLLTKGAWSIQIIDV